ncbi:uncharacterized protein BDR25DRAFT_355303 [Lindgomyces ingoldianus]|uniref:Uncharacterized protein n=1 Tax=Lindgomyces ingoldianus TaxID=673940 RepID=A0ACB6QXJ9_9PLEO|nr:uncharacterized protein BDR25DRAFT_355303 [Lindgomyces ingoldianus]KAF2470812.1 hypothetical protein BDR25DRAFT_355303 [Lindgomyces ingoldianus]
MESHLEKFPSACTLAETSYQFAGDHLTAVVSKVGTTHGKDDVVICLRAMLQQPNEKTIEKAAELEMRRLVRLYWKTGSACTRKHPILRIISDVLVSFVEEGKEEFQNFVVGPFKICRHLDLYGYQALYYDLIDSSYKPLQEYIKQKRAMWEANLGISVGRLWILALRSTVQALEPSLSGNVLRLSKLMTFIKFRGQDSPLKTGNIAQTSKPTFTPTPGRRSLPGLTPYGKQMNSCCPPLMFKSQVSTRFSTCPINRSYTAGIGLSSPEIPCALLYNLTSTNSVMKSMLVSLLLFPLALALVVSRTQKVGYNGYKVLRLSLAKNIENVEAQIEELAAHVLNAGKAEHLDVVVTPNKAEAVAMLAPNQPPALRESKRDKNSGDKSPPQEQFLDLTLGVSAPLGELLNFA